MPKRKSIKRIAATSFTDLVVAGKDFPTLFVLKTADEATILKHFAWLDDPASVELIYDRFGGPITMATLARVKNAKYVDMKKAVSDLVNNQRSILLAEISAVVGAYLTEAAELLQAASVQSEQPESISDDELEEEIDEDEDEDIDEDEDEDEDLEDEDNPLMDDE